MDFCRFTLEHEAFISGNFDTNFVKHHFKTEHLDQKKEDEELVAALLAAKLAQDHTKTASSATPSQKRSKWRANRM